MLRLFVAVLVQMLSGFRKYWHFMIKISKIIAIAAIGLPVFFSHTSFSQKNTYKPDLCNEISVFFLMLVFSTTGSWTYNFSLIKGCNLGFYQELIPQQKSCSIVLIFSSADVIFSLVTILVISRQPSFYFINFWPKLLPQCTPI